MTQVRHPGLLAPLAPARAAPPPPAIDLSRLQLNLSDARTRIGVGTYGTVHVARYFGEYVAVKRVALPHIPPALAADPFVQARRAESLRRFSDEIRRYEAVSHPGIVRFLGVATDTDAALLVSELMPGRSLADALESLRDARTPMELRSLVRVALQACGGLRALHGAGCTWGDVKPGNVLLSDFFGPVDTFPETAEARICDFGLSRSFEDNLLGDTTIEASGQPLGTYNYMAPETFLGLDVRENLEIAKAADMYSFGLLLFEMLTLRKPWRRRQLFEVCDEVRSGARPPWPRPVDTDYYGLIPEALSALVERCWAQDAGARPTADEVFATLQVFNSSLRQQRKGDAQRSVAYIVTGLPVQTGEAQVAHMNASIMQRVPSKQSSVSTAVAIGDVSVSLDLHSSGANSALNSSMEGLTSTRDSAPGVDCSDGDNLDERRESGDQNIAGPTVSAVTLPEQRSPGFLNGLADAQELTLPQVDRKARSTARSANLSTSDPTHYGIMQIPGNFSDIGDAAYAEERHGDLRTPSIGKGHAEAAIQGKFPRVGKVATDAGEEERLKELRPSEDVGFGVHSAVPAILAKVTQMKDYDSPAALPARASPGRTEFDLTTSPVSRHRPEGSTTDQNRVSASPGALKRRRSKPGSISVIEEAIRALLNAQQKIESESKAPPDQRNKAMDGRGSEEAGIFAEHEALLAIEAAHDIGDYSTIIETMTSNRGSIAVMRTGTNYLGAFCKNETLYFDVCEEGGIEELLFAVMNYGESDRALCQSFCQCITTLAEYYDDRIGHRMRAMGVPGSVVQVLQFHRTVLAVQIAGCRCLASIAVASELSRSAVAILGGPRAVYSALTLNNSNFHDADLARASLHAVRHIAQGSEKAAQFFIEAAALDAVSRTVDVFTDDGLEEDILLALRAFAFYNGGRKNIITSSGLRALTEIMLRNREPDFLVRCCTFIREIAQWRDVECHDAVLQSCIAERITSLMQTSSDMYGEEGARVAWYACQACTFLASFGSRSRQRLRQVGAIHKVVGILDHRRDNYRVVKNATDALAELTKGEPEAKIVAERCGAVHALNAALRLHGSNLRVRNALQWTIDCLSPTQNGRPGPALSSTVHQELRNANDVTAVQGIKPRRFLGFKFLQGRKA